MADNEKLAVVTTWETVWSEILGNLNLWNDVIELLSTLPVSTASARALSKLLESYQGHSLSCEYINEKVERWRVEEDPDGHFADVRRHAFNGLEDECMTDEEFAFL